MNGNVMYFYPPGILQLSLVMRFGLVLDNSISTERARSPTAGPKRHDRVNRKARVIFEQLVEKLEN